MLIAEILILVIVSSMLDKIRRDILTKKEEKVKQKNKPRKYS